MRRVPFASPRTTASRATRFVPALAAAIACSDGTAAGDAGRLAMTVDIGAEPIHLAVANADGSRLRHLPHVGREEQPAWSPDGRRIAFARRRYEDIGVWSIGADGRALRRVTGTGFSHPSWR